MQIFLEKQKNGVLIPHDWLLLGDLLSVEVFGDLVSAALLYSKQGTITDFGNSALNALFYIVTDKIAEGG